MFIRFVLSKYSIYFSTVIVFIPSVIFPGLEIFPYKKE